MGAPFMMGPCGARSEAVSFAYIDGTPETRRGAPLPGGMSVGPRRGLSLGLAIGSIRRAVGPYGVREGESCRGGRLNFPDPLIPSRVLSPCSEDRSHDPIWKLTVSPIYPDLKSEYESWTLRRNAQLASKALSHRLHSARNKTSLPGVHHTLIEPVRLSFGNHRLANEQQV
jgi:hypothetical protein